VAALLGDAAMVMGEVGTKLPWFSQKLAEPMGRWMFRADTMAAVVKASGRWLSGVAGVVLGGVTVYEGYKDSRLSKHYGRATMISGLAAIGSAVLLTTSWSGPIAIVLLLFAASVAIAVAWFKPDEVERWLDKVMHFGKNGTGTFESVEVQSDALKRIGRH
jgi:hypothetical protein